MGTLEYMLILSFSDQSCTEADEPFCSSCWSGLNVVLFSTSSCTWVFTGSLKPEKEGKISRSLPLGDYLIWYCVIRSAHRVTCTLSVGWLIRFLSHSDLKVSDLFDCISKLLNIRAYAPMLDWSSSALFFRKFWIIFCRALVFSESSARAKL